MSEKIIIVMTEDNSSFIVIIFIYVYSRSRTIFTFKKIQNQKV